MLTIYKFPLNKGGLVNAKEADMEIEAYVREWLHVGYDPGGQLCVWAKVWDKKPELDYPQRVLHRWVVMIRGTGHDCDDTFNARHIGSVANDMYVWHIFVRAHSVQGD